ncbi:MAG: primosomal protein [Micrococcaceae bacterium]|nr:primosomal protein [Micrococcaceae bacterium]
MTENTPHPTRQSSRQPDGTDGQLSLLHGFGAAKLPQTDPERARILPIARVVLDAQLPHLDRFFDYSVPAAMDAEAQPGVRVKVRFAGREHAGFLAERVAEASTTATLLPLGKVVSPLRVLTPEILALATSVAARSVGTVSDVLRSAVPPRMARVEAEFVLPATAVPEPVPGPTPSEPEPARPREVHGPPASGTFQR